MALLAWYDDQRLGSLSTKYIPTVLDTTTNDVVHVYELLARSDDYLN